MEDGTKLLIGLGVLVALGIGGHQYSQSQKKKKLIAIIVNTPGSDASLSIVSQLSITELEAIVSQMIEEGLINADGTPVGGGAPTTVQN